MNRSFFKCLLFFLLISNIAFAQNQLLNIDELMSKEDQRKTGITKLTPTEKQALEVWLTEWSIQIYNLVQKENYSNSNSSLRSYSNTGDGHWISKNIDNGKFIKLEDGSLWEIMGMDQIYTSLWLEITEITVIEIENSVGDFNYLLVNTDDGEKAYAKLVSQ